MRYNIQMKMADLLENAQAAAALDRFLPGLRPMAEANPQARGLSVEQLARYSRIPQAAEALPALDAALQALNTPENAISPREAEEIARFQALDAADQARAPKPQTHTQNAIYPAAPGSTPRASASRRTAARCFMRTAFTTGTARTKNIPMARTASGPGASRSMPPPI